MKKMLFVGLLLTLIGIVFLKINKQKLEIQTEPDCEAKMIATNKVFEKFEATPKIVDFSNFPEAKTYYTRITEFVKRGVNFSSHYVLIPIGCGTDCVLFVVVDAKTGKVIAYNSGKANYHLINKGSYFILEPIFAGQKREFYKIGEGNQLEVVCTEIATKDYYLPIK